VHEIVRIPLLEKYLHRCGHRLCSTVDDHAPASALVVVEVIHLEGHIGRPYEFGQDPMGRGAEIRDT
jgi:hypothetical protein